MNYFIYSTHFVLNQSTFYCLLTQYLYQFQNKTKNSKKALIIGESFDEMLLQAQKKDFDALVFLFPFKNRKKIEKFALDPSFQVSIDLFFLFLVFKREQAKAHFVLKIASKIIFFTLKKSIF